MSENCTIKHRTMGSYEDLVRHFCVNGTIDRISRSSLWLKPTVYWSTSYLRKEMNKSQFTEKNVENLYNLNSKISFLAHHKTKFIFTMHL